VLIRSPWVIGLVAVIVLGAIGGGLYVLTRDEGEDEDPDRQARIDRMTSYQAEVAAWLAVCPDPCADPTIDREIRRIAADMCALAPLMPKDDIPPTAQVTMQTHRCWDPLTHTDP
jgi:hypothetical protein